MLRPNYIVIFAPISYAPASEVNAVLVEDTIYQPVIHGFTSIEVIHLGMLSITALSSFVELLECRIKANQSK